MWHHLNALIKAALACMPSHTVIAEFVSHAPVGGESHVPRTVQLPVA